MDFGTVINNDSNRSKKTFSYKGFLELQKNAKTIKTKTGFDVTKFATIKEIRKDFRIYVSENKNVVEFLQKQKKADIISNFSHIVNNPELICENLGIVEITSK